MLFDLEKKMWPYCISLLKALQLGYLLVLCPTPSSIFWIIFVSASSVATTYWKFFDFMIPSVYFVHSMLLYVDKIRKKLPMSVLSND